MYRIVASAVLLVLPTPHGKLHHSRLRRHQPPTHKIRENHQITPAALGGAAGIVRLLDYNPVCSFKCPRGARCLVWTDPATPVDSWPITGPLKSLYMFYYKLILTFSVAVWAHKEALSRVLPVGLKAQLAYATQLHIFRDFRLFLATARYLRITASLRFC